MTKFGMAGRGSIRVLARKLGLRNRVAAMLICASGCGSFGWTLLASDAPAMLPPAPGARPIVGQGPYAPRAAQPLFSKRDNSSGIIPQRQSVPPATASDAQPIFRPFQFKMPSLAGKSNPEQSPVGAPEAPPPTITLGEKIPVFDASFAKQPSADAERRESRTPPPLPIAADATTTEMTPELQRLKKKIDETLAIYEQRHQNTRDNTPWEVMHAFVAFNVRTQIRRDGPNGQPVNAIGWILWGQPCHGQPLLTLRNGKPYAEIGVGVQGHPGQLVAMLAQSRVSIDTPLKIQNRDFTLRDYLAEERLDCRPNTELTFRLIALSHYFDLDEKWTSRDGQSWSIPRLLSEEIEAPVRGAACGGIHRLFGITYAYQQRLKRGQPLDGEYARAKKHSENYQKFAWSLMNPDGSFSTDWFNKSGNKPDVDRKIQTTGHVLEWLILAQTDEELRSPRMIKSIDFLATALRNEPRRDWKLGPLGHALHSLVMYNERVFKAPKVPAEMMVQKTPRTSDADKASESPTSTDSKSSGEQSPQSIENDVEAVVPNPADAPTTGPASPNTAPPKNDGKDEGQADEQGEKKSGETKPDEKRTAALPKTNVGPQTYPDFDAPLNAPIMNPFEDPANDPPLKR